MSTLRELKSRIGSVASTQKTTSAMKMISSAKMHKFTYQLQRLLPYRNMVQEVMGHLLVTDAQFTSPLIESRSISSVAIVVFGSDDGLCGAFNINIFKHLLSVINKTRDKHGNGVKVVVLPIGKKIAKACAKLDVANVSVEREHGVNTRSSQEQLADFAQVLSSRFLDGEFDCVEMVYMHYVSTSRQVLSHERLLPVSYEQLAAGAKVDNAAAPCIFEPDANTIFNSILPLHIRSVMQEVFTESLASEQASRVIAMQTASDNAKELLEDLNLEYNKLRQQSITTELLDILGGQVER
ncbi:MAG: ATP synthase F1 subunit gamma [Muribaculaceae bacterium]|nr:ATP synthase F1 subunit gamma [Muribaculaceae bacterium]